MSFSSLDCFDIKMSPGTSESQVKGPTFSVSQTQKELPEGNICIRLSFLFLVLICWFVLAHHMLWRKGHCSCMRHLWVEIVDYIRGLSEPTEFFKPMQFPYHSWKKALLIPEKFQICLAFYQPATLCSSGSCHLRIGWAPLVLGMCLASPS